MESPDVAGSARERVLVRNVDDKRRRVRVVRRRNGDSRVDAVELSPDDQERFALPEGTGTVTVEIDGEDNAGVATSYDPDHHPALFTIRDGSVLVART
jgi:hypothetical protein